MAKRRLSRRDILKGSRPRSAPPHSRRACSAQAPGRRSGHARADRGGEEGRQGRLVHLGRPAARREGRQGVRGEISRHRGAGGALRRRARVPAHRPGIFQQHPRRRRGQLVRRRAPDRVEARRLARALRAGGRREVLSGRAQGRGRQFASFRVMLSVIAYNTTLVKAGGCAEELRRSARSEMGRQDGQGASGLFAARS